MFARKHNPFEGLKEKLRAQEAARVELRRNSERLCRSAYRKWNKEIIYLLRQLTNALKQSQEWRSRSLHVGTFALHDNGFPSVGWRLYWMRPYGIGRSNLFFRECEFLDIVTISLKLDSKGQPAGFSVFKEEDGQRITTRRISSDDLVETLQVLFVGNT